MSYIHPLQNYFDLVDNNGINRFINNFYNQHYFIISKLQSNCNLQVEWNEEKKAYIIEDGISNSELDFHTHISQTLNNNSKKFKNYIRNYALVESEKDTILHIKRLQNEINSLIKALNGKTEEGVDLILKSLIEIENFSSNYTTEQYQENQNEQKSNLKIKWLGKINTLVTLFFDLSQETNNLKTKFIEYNRQELTDFIVGNFIDSKGNTIEPSTVYRILDANPTDFKKAKQRIEINSNPTIK